MCAKNYSKEPRRMHNNKPRLSIGMPVFNGEKYLKEALDSILRQTYEDFELIISDNASTDNTEKICRHYMTLDDRIRYHRNRINIGAPGNYNTTVKLSRCEYFKWAAADDVHAPTYLEKCVSVLDRDPSIVLCHSKTARINEQGKRVGTYEHKMRIDSQKRHERFADLISLWTNPCWPIFGVMRKNILELTPMHGDYRGADANLLAEISLYGRLFEVPEYLFLRRDHEEAYTRKLSGKYTSKNKNMLNEQMTWWSSSGWFNYVYLKNCLEFFYSVRRAPLRWSDRIRCYWEIFKWFPREGWKLFGTDIEHYVLSRSTFGCTTVRIIKKIMRKIGINIAEIEI